LGNSSGAYSGRERNKVSGFFGFPKVLEKKAR
jgi:hypothetical protein